MREVIAERVLPILLSAIPVELAKTSPYVFLHPA